MALVDLRRLGSCRKDFSKYLSLCEILEKRSDRVSFSLRDDDVSQHQIDRVSLQIIPGSFKEPFLPVRSTGDGNCLFNSASIAICQDETLAHELRLRTSIELAIHRDFYRNHPVLRAAKIQFNSRKDGVGFLPMESLFDLTCFNSESETVFAKEGFEAAFLNEVMVSSVNFTYSGTLQIMGLASVVGVSIETLYPEQTNKLLSIYQNTFHSRNGRNSDQVLRIMWTNTSGWPDQSKEFKVNHFVPLLRKSLQERKPDADWKFVSHKRKQTNTQWNCEKGLKRQGKNARSSPSVKTHKPHKSYATNKETQEPETAKFVKGKGTVQSGRAAKRWRSKIDTVKQQENTKTQRKLETNGNPKRSWSAGHKGEKIPDNEKKHSAKPTHNPTRVTAQKRKISEQRLRGENATVPGKKKSTAQQDSTRLPAGNSTESGRAARNERESKSTAEQQIETPGPLQTKGNSEKGTSKDDISEEAMENERENSAGVQQLKHAGVTRENEKNPNITRFEDETDKTAMSHEKIDAVKEQTGETQDTMSAEKNLEETPITVEVNENSDYTHRVDQNMETDSENQTAEQPEDVNGNKYSDKAYLFEQYLKRRSPLPIPCASKKFYYKQNLNATKNSTRTARRTELPSLQGPNKEMIALQRSKVDGTLLENIKSIESELNICKDKTKRAELMGAIDVAKFKRKYFSRQWMLQKYTRNQKLLS